MAMPVGGQKGLALGCTVARRRLSFAARIYVAHAATPIRSCFNNGERQSLRSIRVREGRPPGTGFGAYLPGSNSPAGSPIVSVKIRSCGSRCIPFQFPKCHFGKDLNTVVQAKNAGGGSAVQLA